MTTLRAEPAGRLDARRQAADHPRLAPGRVSDLAVVGLPAGLALVVCAVGITARSLGFDEGASVAIASQDGSALGHAIAHDGGNMSGYYLLLHVLIDLFGRGLLVIRAPSALAAAVTVALVGWLGLRLFDRRVAAVAGVLTAVSLPLVFWGQSARGYAPMIALTTGSFAAFVALVGAGRSDPERRRHPRAAWIAYVLCTTLAVYTGFVAVLVVPAQLLLLAGRREAVRKVASALALSALCWVPLVVLAAGRGSGQLFWVPRPSRTAEKQVLEALTSAGVEPSFHRTAGTHVLLGLTVAMLVVMGLGAWSRAVRGRQRGRRPGWMVPDWRVALLLSWLLVPVLLAWSESLIGQPVFLPRNLLPVLPAVGLLLALAVTDARVPAPAAWAVLSVLLLLRGWQLVAGYGVSPEDWKSATAHVLARSQPGDCIAFYPGDARMAFAYYVSQGDRSPRSVLPVAGWGRQQPFVENYAVIPPATLGRLPSQCPRLWLVSSHEGQPDGPAGSRANLIRLAGLRAALAGEYADWRTSRFGYAATITAQLFSGPRGGTARSRP